MEVYDIDITKLEEISNVTLTDSQPFDTQAIYLAMEALENDLKEKHNIELPPYQMFELLYAVVVDKKKACIPIFATA